MLVLRRQFCKGARCIQARKSTRLVEIVTYYEKISIPPSQIDKVQEAFLSGAVREDLIDLDHEQALHILFI